MRRLVRLLLIVFAFGSAFAGDTVSLVQQKLKRLGYYHGQIDGDMGSQTAAAIRRFQVAEKLRPTGQLDEETLTRLGFSEAGK